LCHISPQIIFSYFFNHISTKFVKMQKKYDFNLNSFEKQNLRLHKKSKINFRSNVMVKNVQVKTTVQTPGFWHIFGGIVMVLLGIYVIFNPAVSLLGLALYMGIAFIVVGAGYFMASFSAESGWYLMVGLLDLFVGVILVSNLGVTAATLPIIFALWCLAVGIIQLVAAIQNYRGGTPWLWTMLTGVLGILFAFLILVYPVFGAVALTTLMGAYIILYGALTMTDYYTTRQVARI